MLKTRLVQCSDKWTNTHLTCSGCIFHTWSCTWPHVQLLTSLCLNKSLSTWLILSAPISDQVSCSCVSLHVWQCIWLHIWPYLFDPLPAASFWNEHSLISVIHAKVLFVFKPSLGSQRKKALGFESIQSPWCSSFGIYITTCQTSFPCGWVQSSCVHWQQQCFLSTYDLTLKW